MKNSSLKPFPPTTSQRMLFETAVKSLKIACEDIALEWNSLPEFVVKVSSI